MKATVQPPKEGFVPNPQRISNPFSRDTEPDWVLTSGLKRRDTDMCVERKPLPPPRHRTFDAINSTQSREPRVLDKVPPTIPRKPLSLTSHTAHRTSIPSSVSAAFTTSKADSTRRYQHESQEKTDSGTSDLLDDHMNEEIDWKPLIPQ